MRTLSRPTTRLVPRLHLSQSQCFWVMGMRPHVPRLPCLACFVYLCTSAVPTSFKLLLLFTDLPKIASYKPATWVLFPTCLLSFKIMFTPLCVLTPEDVGKQSNTPTKYNLYCQWCSRDKACWALPTPYCKWHKCWVRTCCWKWG